MATTKPNASPVSPYRVTAETEPSAGRSYPVYTVYLTGPEGAVQFKFAGADLRIAQQFRDLHVWLEDGTPLQGFDLGVHSPKPLYGDDEPIERECPVIGGVPCYYDGSGLNADRVLRGWIGSGSDTYLIGEMADWYEHHFDTRPHDIAFPGRPMGALTYGARAVNG
jgi:hypothetical protein